MCYLGLGARREEEGVSEAFGVSLRGKEGERR